MSSKDVLEILNRPLAQELLKSGIPVRMAYSAADGSPRVIPIGFFWNGVDFEVFTLPNAPKVKALAADPRVALTIDTTDFPPHILLVRGEAEIEIVDGVPSEYLEASRKYVGDEGMAEFETNVRQLYDQMARITIHPTWAKLIDFETTLPSPVEELVRSKMAG